MKFHKMEKRKQDEKQLFFPRGDRSLEGDCPGSDVCPPFFHVPGMDYLRGGIPMDSGIYQPVLCANGYLRVSLRISYRLSFLLLARYFALRTAKNYGFSPVLLACCRPHDRRSGTSGVLHSFQKRCAGRAAWGAESGNVFLLVRLLLLHYYGVTSAADTQGIQQSGTGRPCFC